MQLAQISFPQGLKPNPSLTQLAARLTPRPFKVTEPASQASDLPQGFVLRSTTTDDLQAYLAGADPVETTWLSPAQQHEEAWFLGLRLNAGVEVAALEQEFSPTMVAPALDAVKRLVEAGLLVTDGNTVLLTPRGQLLSNDVFEEFLELEPEASAATRLQPSA